MPARISIDGNLVADPDFGVGDSGASWAHLRIASHERIRRDGEWISTDPEYYNVTLFGPAAETAANDLHKGDRVLLTGRLRQREYTTKDGEKRSTIELDVEEIGVSLRYATAEPRKNARTSGAGAGNPGGDEAAHTS